jgi:hypothetical protein
MTKPIRSSFNEVLRVWIALIGAIFQRSGRLRGVFLHDPASDRPKNLDNPFHDAGAQERVGDFIARSTQRKTQATEIVSRRSAEPSISRESTCASADDDADGRK